jgi:hypothetical protein
LPTGKDLVDIQVDKQGKTSDINMFREQQRRFNIEQKFTGDKGYQGGMNIKLPKRWTVERTYGWLHWCRRLNVDYERLPASSEAFIHKHLCYANIEIETFFASGDCPYFENFVLKLRNALLQSFFVSGALLSNCH